MEKEHNSDSVIYDPLIDVNTNSNGERSDSFIRRSTFVPSSENEKSQDIELLKEMGFDEKIIKKIYLVFKPRNINDAIEMMSEVDGVYQHDFYESRFCSNINRCCVCKKERKFHRDYNIKRDSHLRKKKSKKEEIELN